jgi:hypothetical protein
MMHVRIARAMAIEASCVLGAWVERDEGFRDLSPSSVAEIVYSRMIRVSLPPELASQAPRPLPPDRLDES